MQWSSPARLFHAIVLAGAAFGASSCQGKQSGTSTKDAAGEREALMDAGNRDASGRDSTDAPDLALGDASTDGPRDASCDVVCQHRADSCQCIIIIL